MLRGVVEVHDSVACAASTSTGTAYRDPNPRAHSQLEGQFLYAARSAATAYSLRWSVV
jgi:hypothetical protein